MIRNIISETKQLRIFGEVVVLPEPPVADTVTVSGFLGQHGRYFIYDYYYVSKHSYYILLYIIIITL